MQPRIAFWNHVYRTATHQLLSLLLLTGQDPDFCVSWVAVR